MQFGWKLKHDSAPYYHKRTKLITNQLIVSLPPWLKVSLSPNLSSGPSSVLALLCPLMKSLDTRTPVLAKSVTSLLISRKQEVSSPQSVNDQPFTNHFKMRTFRYNILLNYLVTLPNSVVWSIFSRLSVVHQICIWTSCGWSFKREGCQCLYRRFGGHL